MTAPTATLSDRLEELGLMFSSAVVKRAVASAKAGLWRYDKGEWFTLKPHPMGIYDSDQKRIFYAIGWGRHEVLWPWERWVLRRALATLQDGGEG